MCNSTLKKRSNARLENERNIDRLIQLDIILETILNLIVNLNSAATCYEMSRVEVCVGVCQKILNSRSTNSNSGIAVCKNGMIDWVALSEWPPVKIDRGLIFNYVCRVKHMSRLNWSGDTWLQVRKAFHLIYSTVSK